MALVIHARERRKVEHAAEADPFPDVEGGQEEVPRGGVSVDVDGRAAEGLDDGVDQAVLVVEEVVDERVHRDPGDEVGQKEE